MQPSYQNIQNEYNNNNFNNPNSYPTPPPPAPPLSRPQNYHHDEVSSDIVIGITQQDERARTHSLITMINVDAYDEDNYGSLFVGALKLNNFIYKYCYLFFGLIFAVFLGTIMSFFTAISTAIVEWVNLFILRPSMKQLAIIMQSVKSAILLLAQAVAPLFELIFPGTFKNWTYKKD